MKKGILFTALFLFSVALVMSQGRRNPGSNTIPLIGVEAPSFTAESTMGTVNFPADFGANWKIIFAHPKDFTPVCSSEILELAYHQESFNNLNASLLVLSTDVLSQHFLWKSALEEINYKDRGAMNINFPLVSDDSYRVSKLYGMIHSEESIGENIRGVFIIDPDNKVRTILYYPNEVGRNIDELKRTLIALQTTKNDNNVVTPANWQPGDDYLVPVISAQEKADIGSPDSPYYQLSWFMTYLKNRK
ncbi:MAG: redoxin domain-containing protein [Bacteroidales bacterium]